MVPYIPVRAKIVHTLPDLYNKSTTNRSNGVRGLRLTDVQKPATTRRLSFRCRQQARPSTTTTTTCFVDHAIALPWRNYVSPEFETKSRRNMPYFWRYPNSVKTHSVEWVEGSLHDKHMLDPSSRFDTTPACDRRTDERDDSIYRASTAYLLTHTTLLFGGVAQW